MTATEADRRATGSEILRMLATAATDFERAIADRPLAFWRAWHRPRPRTSQRVALQDLVEYRDVVWLGGNRSGKTQLARAALVALVLGSDHPDARAFWLGNGLDPDAFPRGPGRGYLVALTSNDSLRYHRRQTCALLPRGTWSGWNLNGRGEAHVEITVPGYSEPAEIWFKSEDQGEEGMQGDSVRVVVHDEEGKTRAVRQEASTRLIDQQGWQILANTPLHGRTWLYHEVVKPALDKHPDAAGVSVRWLHTRDNPHLPPGAADAIARKDRARAKAKTEGEFVTVEGAVFEVFAREMHVLPRWTPPQGLGIPLFRAADVGIRNPTAIPYAAYLTSDTMIGDRLIREGSLVVYRCLYGAGESADEWARRMRAAEQAGAEQIECGWIDPSAAQTRLRWGELDLPFAPGMNDIRQGIAEVLEWLTPDQTGDPRLYITEDCGVLIEQLENLVYPEHEGPDERPVKRDDHATDALRYLVTGVRRWLGLAF